MSKVKYHYAIDGNGKLINISAITESCRNNVFRCPGCGELMRPRLGECRAHHFAHKNDVFNCKPETYIHKLAKQKIKEWFDSDIPFKISYYQDTICSDATTCPFYKSEKCHDRQLRDYNLKEYYDTCSCEKAINDFVADLLISSQKRPYAPPILIEIQVTHKSEIAKLESGHKIIEIKINSEGDIEHLLESAVIEEDDDSAYTDNPKQISSIKFFGFKRETLASHLEMRDISKFYLYSSGKAYVTNMDSVPSCREVVKRDNPYAILELAIDRFHLDYISIYDIGYTIAKQLGYSAKICQQCKYWKRDSEFNGICCLYKRYNTQRYPEDTEAMSCQYYREDPVIAKEIGEAIAQTPIVIIKQQVIIP